MSLAAGSGIEGNGGVDTNDHVLVIQELLRNVSAHLRDMDLAEGSGMEGNGVHTNDHVLEIQEENIIDGIISLAFDRMRSNHVLASSIAAKRNKVPRQNLQECCIHRVPPVFLNGNEQAYTPQMVSIGPFHRGCKNLQAMELHKLQYLNDFLDRFSRMKLEQFIDSLRGLEERARLCYGEPISLTSDVFIEMMLIDGCFILEFFLKRLLGEKRDTLSTSVLMLVKVQEEITDLLENQLPFFVLEHLFYLVFPRSFSFLELSVAFVSQKHVNHSVKELSQSVQNQEVKHFVDLQRKFYVPTSPTRIPPSTGYEFKFIPSATELHASGVKFTKDKCSCFLDITFTKNDKRSCFLDITFTRNDKRSCFLGITFTKTGVFNIPSIRIVDNTNRRFRNLIALEHFDQQAGYVSDYAVLMDCLINTPDDVALLRRYGIIENWLGDDQEVSLLFNAICKGQIINSNTFYYAKLFEDVNIYYKKRWHKWRATLTRDYFSTPWSIISFLAAVVLLVCTFLQTLYAVKKP